MGSTREEIAANIPPPRKAICLATVTTVQKIKIPKRLCQGWVEIHNDDASARLGLNFGSSSADVDDMTNLTAVSTVTDDLPDEPTGVPGMVLGPHQREHVNLADFDFAGELNANADIWLGHISSATGGYIRIRKSSGPTAA